jgi:hypothetical protein
MWREDARVPRAFHVVLPSAAAFCIQPEVVHQSLSSVGVWRGPGTKCELRDGGLLRRGDDGGARGSLANCSCDRASYPAPASKYLLLPRSSSYYILLLSQLHPPLKPILTNFILPQTIPYNTAIMSQNWTKETFTLNTVSH